MSSVRFRVAGMVAGVFALTVFTVGSDPALASKRPPTKVIDPVTMGALQIVNVLDGDGAVTVSVAGRVRARGVPSLVATAPVVVPSGDQVVRIGDGRTEIGSIVVNVPAGSRRTLFLVGNPDLPRATFVDAPSRLGDITTRAVRVIDLRPPALRTDVLVDGVVHAVDASGLSTPFTTAASPRVTVDGILSAPNVGLGTSVLFITDRSGSVVATSLRQDLVGLDSLRSPAALIVKVHQSPVRLLGALALMFAATVAALSSMTVFRSRSRDDRTRGLMAKSFLL